MDFMIRENESIVLKTHTIYSSRISTAEHTHCEYPRILLLAIQGFRGNVVGERMSFQIAFIIENPLSQGGNMQMHEPDRSLLEEKNHIVGCRVAQDSDRDQQWVRMKESCKDIQRKHTGQVRKPRTHWANLKQYCPALSP